MAVSNKNNVVDRQSKGLPISIQEHDTNLQELRYVIDDAAANEQDLSDHMDSTNPHPNYTPPITSVFSRTGDVTAQANDYEANQVEFDPTGTNLLSTEVQGAVNELDQNIDSHVTSSNAHDAADIAYDDTGSSITASTTQQAVDALDTSKVASDSVASLNGVRMNEDGSVAGSGSVTLDVSANSSFIIDATGAVDITLSNAPANKTQEVWVKGNNSGGSITFTTAVVWDTGTEPTINTTYTIYHLVWIGGAWYGSEFASN